MRYFNKITILENRKRIDKLLSFNNSVVNYFNNVRREYLSTDIIENQTAKESRRQINMSIKEAKQLILSSGTNTVYSYTPPPMIGGYIKNIDIIENIFLIYQYELNPSQIVDVIERAIGVYQNDISKSIIRTFNPLFWLNRIIEEIISIPFKLIGKLGFNQNKIETSLIGRLIKGILYLITVAAALLTVLEKLGYLEKFKLWLLN